MTAKAAERRRAPREDVLSKLALAELDGERLSDAELGMFCLTLLVAGNETTRNLISGGMRALLERSRAVGEAAARIRRCCRTRSRRCCAS